MGKNTRDTNRGRWSVINCLRILIKRFWRIFKNPKTVRLLMVWLRLFTTIARLFDWWTR